MAGGGRRVSIEVPFSFSDQLQSIFSLFIHSYPSLSFLEVLFFSFPFLFPLLLFLVDRTPSPGTGRWRCDRVGRVQQLFHLTLYKWKSLRKRELLLETRRERKEYFYRRPGLGTKIIRPNNSVFFAFRDSILLNTDIKKVTLCRNISISLIKTRNLSFGCPVTTQ